MPRKRDIERRLDDLEDSDADKPLAAMPTEELAKAWRAALDPDRPNPGIEGSDAYAELLGRKYE